MWHKRQYLLQHNQENTNTGYYCLIIDSAVKQENRFEHPQREHLFLALSEKDVIYDVTPTGI